jgi:hypothetical protein
MCRAPAASAGRAGRCGGSSTRGRSPWGSETHDRPGPGRSSPSRHRPNFYPALDGKPIPGRSVGAPGLCGRRRGEGEGEGEGEGGLSGERGWRTVKPGQDHGPRQEQEEVRGEAKSRGGGEVSGGRPRDARHGGRAVGSWTWSFPVERGGRCAAFHPVSCAGAPHSERGRDELHPSRAGSDFTRASARAGSSEYDPRRSHQRKARVYFTMRVRPALTGRNSRSRGLRSVFHPSL